MKLNVYHYGQTKRTPIVTFGDTCPVCEQNSNLILTKQELFDILIVIPMWKKEYLVTCDKCSAIIEMDKKVGEQLEQAVRNKNLDNLISLITIKDKYGEIRSTMYHPPVVKTGIHCYDVLGIDDSATFEEVRAAYVKKANAAQPSNGGNVEAALEINAAYDMVLKLKGWSK